jgi:hypothetical protein
MVAQRGESVVEIKRLDMQTVLVPIEGTTELIVHNWSEKAQREMLDKQMGKARTKREPKNPEQEYESSKYRLPDGREGFTAVGFKAAIVGACRNFEGLPMTLAKIAIFVHGEMSDNGVPLVEIEGASRMRRDMVRLETGVADIRFRAGYPVWRTVLKVTYNASVISLEQLYNLIEASGWGGIGEWRPSAPKSKTGDFGRYHIAA